MTKGFDNVSVEFTKNISDEMDFDLCFIWACSNGYINRAKYILSISNVDVNSNNGLPIQLAAAHDHLHMVDFLISKGARPFAVYHNELILRRIFLLNNKKMLKLLNLKK